MRKSPFPGMDPYLEQDWIDVHTRLINSIADQIHEQLPDDLCARLESRVLVESSDDLEDQSRNPDVRIIERPGGGRTASAVAELPRAADIEPDLYLVTPRAEPVTQRFIQIVDAPTRSRVITTIELISPSNKLPGPGRRLYAAKRKEHWDSDVNFVEIDLTRGGDRLSILPELRGLAVQPIYVALVYRASRPIELAIYKMPLDQPLKPIRVPLRPDDEDVVINLQPLVAQAYERGRYDTLDYSRPLDPPLTSPEAEFVEHVLEESGKLRGGKS